MKTIDVLFEEQEASVEEIADRAGMEEERVYAIAVGRWTPSPAERAKIAAALGVGVESISWGHSISPRNIRYHRFGLEEDFNR
ncbi:MAG: helix-turn-helix transcriptional regulator [Pirellulales bacterium]